jgi:penicillin-binding protein 1A
MRANSKRRLRDMTDDFDFDFDVDRGRSRSHMQEREPGEVPAHGTGRDLDESENEGRRFAPRSDDDIEVPELDFGFGDIEDPLETPPPVPADRPEEPKEPAPEGPSRPAGSGNGSAGNGSEGNGSVSLQDRAKELLSRRGELMYQDEEPRPARPRPPAHEPPATPEEPPAAPGEVDRRDWLDFDDENLGADISSLREQGNGPAGPPTPGEGRKLAKEARRRAARRPSPILDLDAEREQRRTTFSGEEVDFEEMLERQPQKSGVARRGSAIRNAVRGGMESLRRVGGERIAESRDRVHALRERVPSRVPVPRPATGGDGKPPPPSHLPRRISARRPRKPQPGRIKWFRIAVIVVGLGMLAIVATFFGMMMAISRDLPQLENKKEFAEAKNSIVLDDQGNTIGALLNNNQRILLESADISPYMKEATVAIEDQRFYEHSGVDIKGLFRAGFENLVPGGSTQGGSTITEQFVKNALEAQNSRTVFQKFREAALAYQIERHWDKDKILTEYLNTIYFGEGAYGIEAAARTYFGWNHPGCGRSGGDPCAKELTPAEAAMLAGIITSPSAFSPRVNPQAALERRNLVLENMKEQNYISDDEYEESIKEALPAASNIQRPQSDSASPYFTEWLRQQVVDLYGPGRAFSGGLAIRSTLDLDMQQTAQEIAQNTLAGVAPTASVVVIDNETGGVKAMVGGNDYEDHPFNLATNGHRQPGSAFKPFTLATALSQGISTGTSYTSNEKIFKVPGSQGKEYFDVHNYEDTYYGSSSLETATIHSDNSVYAELALGHDLHCSSGCGGSPAVRGGTRRIAQTAHDMGIDTKFSTNPSMVLGAIDPGVTPLEMAHAYSTIATGGERIGGNLDTSAGPNNTPEDLGPVAIEKVTDPEGKKVAEDKPKKIRVLSSGVADTMKNILRENVLGGTGVLAQSAPNAWGKTGTTENNGDAWFCGGTDHFTACVWVGHADSTEPMETEYNGGPVDGGTYPAYIWGQIMAAIEDIYAEHKAEENDDEDSDSSDSSSSDSSSSYSGSSTGSSGSGGGGDNGGGGGGRATAPAPAPSGGGGGAAIGGGTGGTGL